MNRSPVIGITLGDPGGIGPEVVVKALQALGDEVRRVVIYGGRGVFDDAVRRYLADDSAAKDHATEDVARATSSGPARAPSTLTIFGKQSIEFRGHEFSGTLTNSSVRPSATAEGGEHSFRCVEMGIADALRAPSTSRHKSQHSTLSDPSSESDPSLIDALVTGPISKEAWTLAGHAEFAGHTELLAARCGVERPVMAFFGRVMRVSLVTAHVPLARVADSLSAERITEVIAAGAKACERLGVPRPRIAVCGLNPHAGEKGLLGDEDERVIRPGIAAARARGIDANGPWPADTVFIAARAGAHDMVVAMYHDQGLIPVKLLERDEAVNVTLGLPIVRTSPDHGTALDIAGRGVADPGSTIAAIRLAIRLAERA